jgi:hypothetical protein
VVRVMPEALMVVSQEFADAVRHQRTLRATRPVAQRIKMGTISTLKKRTAAAAAPGLRLSRR